MTCCCKHQIEKDDADIRSVIKVVEEIRGRSLVFPWTSETIELIRQKNEEVQRYRRLNEDLLWVLSELRKQAKGE